MEGLHKIWDKFNKPASHIGQLRSEDKSTVSVLRQLFDMKHSPFDFFHLIPFLYSLRKLF